VVDKRPALSLEPAKQNGSRLTGCAAPLTFVFFIPALRCNPPTKFEITSDVTGPDTTVTLSLFEP